MKTPKSEGPTGGPHRRLLIPCLFLLMTLSVLAAPFRDKIITFKQPDGTTVQLIGSGDEFYAVFETLDGYTVVFDPARKAYCFAQLGSDGQLVSSGVQVQVGPAAAPGVPLHLRAAPAIRQQQNLAALPALGRGHGCRGALASSKSRPPSG